MKSSTIIVLLVAILLPLCSCDIIDSTCARTPNPDHCVTLLRSNPKSSDADITGLSPILVDIVKNKSINAVDFVIQLEKSKPELKKQLNECRDKYKFIKDSDVSVAIEALTKGDPKFAVDSMNDASIEIRICEGGFKINSSPLSSVNNDMIDTCVVTTAIIRNLL